MSVRDRPASANISSRRAARLQARDQQRRRDVRRRRLQAALWGGVALLVAAGVGLIVVRAVQGQPGRPVPLQGQQHVSKGEAHLAYNSKPPTSGPHWNIPGEAPVAWGVHKDPIPNEAQIHNLEHGGVVISYNCRDCPDLVAELEGFYGRFVGDPANRLPLFPNSSKIMVAPYYDMPTQIALTAWGRIDTFDTFDEGRVRRFIETWRGKGPEPNAP